MQLVFGYSFPGLTFEVILHLGSILAVILYFRQDIIQLIQAFFRYLSQRNAEDRLEFMFSIYIAAATLITGLLGMVLEDILADSIKTPVFIASSLVLTGFFLILIERFHKIGHRTEENMTFFDSVVVGLAQTLAVLPGISRSGSTLIAALYAGLNRETAVRYSFLLSIPVILGSSVLAFGDISGGALEAMGTTALITAFFASFLTSWIGIVWLIHFLNKGRLIYFALYCFVLAIVVVTFLENTQTVATL